MQVHAVRILATSALLAAGMLMASEPAGAPAALRPTAERKPAPEFILPDSTGRTMTLRNYRGKVVLLDLWANWCNGCKLEITWFEELLQMYAVQGYTVDGV